MIAMLTPLITRNISDKAIEATILPSPFRVEGQSKGEENVYRGNIDYQ
jgi:hypothetical protein